MTREEAMKKMTNAVEALVERQLTNDERWTDTGPHTGTQYRDCLNDYRSDYILEDGREVGVIFSGPDNEAKAWFN